MNDRRARSFCLVGTVVGRALSSIEKLFSHRESGVACFMPSESDMKQWPLALIRQHCPRCREGALFAGAIEMHRRCPVCALDLEPEVGYYTGAMVVSYTLSIPLLGLVALGVGLVTRWELHWVIVAASVLFIAFIVPLFRYARSIWLYLDWSLNPGSFRGR